MRYTDVDFKLERTSRDICGTYGMAFYQNHAVWYKHRCNRLDCPRCRDYYLTRWKDRIAIVFNDNIYMLNIKTSQFSSFRHKHSRIPYVRIHFNNHYTILTNIELPSSVPVTIDEVINLIQSQRNHIKNFITANRVFYKEVSCHVLHIRDNNNIYMQKVAKGEFLGRAVRPFDDDNPHQVISAWQTSNDREKASILKNLHEKGVLRLTNEGKEFVKNYADGCDFHTHMKTPDFVLAPDAICIFETKHYIGYIIPSRK